MTSVRQEPKEIMGFSSEEMNVNVHIVLKNPRRGGSKKGLGANIKWLQFSQCISIVMQWEEAAGAVSAGMNIRDRS